MNAQEMAPKANEEQGLPLPTADMSGDDLFRLGMMYSSGQGGCPMDRVSAHMIFNLAAMKGSIEARVYRREMSQEMEQDEIAEAQKAARRWIDAGVVRPSLAMEILGQYTACFNDTTYCDARPAAVTGGAGERTP